MLIEIGEERAANADDVLYRVRDRDYPIIAIIEGEVAVLDAAGTRCRPVPVAAESLPVGGLGSAWAASTSAPAAEGKARCASSAAGRTDACFSRVAGFGFLRP